eukprot:PITA_13868
MGSKAKEEAIRNIRTETPDILLVQETKLEDIVFLHSSKKIWYKSEARAISSRGASGGIGTVWNRSKFSVLYEVRDTHWLLLKMQNLATKEIFCLFNVYSPTIVADKKNCWDSIRHQADLVHMENIIIAGDLNLTLHSSRKRGGSIVRDPAREWAEDILQEWDMLDIKPSSSKYSWSNKRLGPGHIAARLDRFFIQSSFLLLGIEPRMHILPNNISDHKPIKLELLAHLDLGPIPFRFSPLWIKELGFMQIVKDSWNQQRYHKACLAEEEYWRVKSRNLWLKAGDRNTAFFHKQSQVRKCFNSISEIKVENVTHKDFDYIKKTTFLHFQSLYSEDKDLNQNSDLLDVVPTVITQQTKDSLEAKITKEEVEKDLFAMDPDKAPGSDGLSSRFLQVCWPIIEKDLLKMVHKSQNT